MNTSATSITKASPSPDDRGQQIKALRADLMKFAATTTADMSEGIGRAGKQIRQTGQDAKATAARAVLDHPLSAIGIAAGVGFLLGIVTRKG